MQEEKNKALALKDFPIKDYAFNTTKLGELTFDISYKYFEDLRKFFVDLEELNFKTKLSKDEVDQIENHRRKFVDEFLVKLKNFDIKQDQAVQKRDNLEKEIEKFYSRVMDKFRSTLTHLKVTSLEETDLQQLQKHKNDIDKARQVYKKISYELQNKLENLEKKQKEVEQKKNEVEAGHGEVAAKILGKHFDVEAKDHFKEKQKWLKKRGQFFWSIVTIVMINLFVYFLIIFLKFEIENEFFIRYGIGKIALLSILSYGLVFASKNYRIESHLNILNQHRKNVAQTIDDFLESTTDPEVRAQIIKQGTEAMFHHAPSGFISKSDAEDKGPIQEIVNYINPKK